MLKNRVWFVEPIGEANESIAREVFGGDRDYSTQMCSDRRRHRLWECDEELLVAAKKARTGKGFVFKIWRRIGEGNIYPHREKPSKTRQGKTLVRRLAREAIQRSLKNVTVTT